MKFGIWLFAILFLQGFAFADQFGNVIYERPEGWTSVQQADSKLLIPAEVPKGAVFTLAIRKGSELKGRTLQQFLDDTLKAELSTGATIVSSTPVDSGKTFAGVPILTTTRVMATREKAQYLNQYFVLAAGDRGEVVSIISNSVDLVKRYAYIVGRFVASLQFANIHP